MGTADEWQKSGAKFLEGFYDDLRQKGYPAYLFHSANAEKFTSQDYFSEFKKCNENLFICPSCDETRFNTTSRGRSRFTIDHYLRRLSTASSFHSPL